MAILMETTGTVDSNRFFGSRAENHKGDITFADKFDGIFSADFEFARVCETFIISQLINRPRKL